MLKDELLARGVEGAREMALRGLRRDIITVHLGHPITELFSAFLATREHIALVVDQFGGTAGIVTMEDVIETLLGVEIVDESDQAADMQILARRHWEHRAKRLGVITDSADPATTTLDKMPDVE